MRKWKGQKGKSHFGNILILIKVSFGYYVSFKDKNNGRPSIIFSLIFYFQNIENKNMFNNWNIFQYSWENTSILDMGYQWMWIFHFNILEIKKLIYYYYFKICYVILKNIKEKHFSNVKSIDFFV